MITWTDSKQRVVSLEVLENICRDISGTCHRYEIHKCTPNRVYVSYSNPDEYANEHPMIAVFPCYKTGQMINVIMDIVNVHHDNWDGEGWQAFSGLMDTPSRNPNA